MQRSSIKSISVKLSALLVLLIVLLNVRSIILGGATHVTLKSAPALSSQISQAFTSGGDTTLPKIGKDYQQKLRYFDGNDWIVASVTPVGNAITPGVLVLQKQHGLYTVVLGPGSAFPVTAVDAIPTDVAQYLDSIGVIYEPY